MCTFRGQVSPACLDLPESKAPGRAGGRGAGLPHSLFFDQSTGFLNPRRCRINGGDYLVPGRRKRIPGSNIGCSTPSESYALCRTMQLCGSVYYMAARPHSLTHLANQNLLAVAFLARRRLCHESDLRIWREVKL